MEHTSQGQPPATTVPGAPGAPRPHGMPGEDRRGCLFALSQPPLMIFLTVIACLLLVSAVHDLYLL